MAVLMSVPGTVVLATIVHDLAPAQRNNVLKLSGTTHCAQIDTVCTDWPFAGIRWLRILEHAPIR